MDKRFLAWTASRREGRPITACDAWMAAIHSVTGDHPLVPTEFKRFDEWRARQVGPEEAISPSAAWDAAIKSMAEPKDQPTPSVAPAPDAVDDVHEIMMERASSCADMSSWTRFDASMTRDEIKEKLLGPAAIQKGEKDA